MTGKQMVAGVVLSRVLEAFPSNVVFSSVCGVLNFSTWSFTYYYLLRRSLGPFARHFKHSLRVLILSGLALDIHISFKVRKFGTLLPDLSGLANPLRSPRRKPSVKGSQASGSR